MAVSVLWVGENNCNELASSTTISKQLVRSGITNRSTQIKHILSGNKFTIYCDEGYQNIWTAGHNDYGELAANDFDDIDGIYSLTFFKDNNIKIREASVTSDAHTVFWITESNTAYGHGHNFSGNLGINDSRDKWVPTLIDLENVIDIQPSPRYSVALCSNASSNIVLIIQYWLRIRQNEVPDDIMNIMIQYYTINQVYSAGRSLDGAHGHGKMNDADEWTEIEQLRDKNIVQIRVGFDHSYFLDSKGIIIISHNLRF